eukprot:316053-Amphidinium_carterae.1
MACLPETGALNQAGGDKQTSDLQPPRVSFVWWGIWFGMDSLSLMSFAALQTKFSAESEREAVIGSGAMSHGKPRTCSTEG